MMIGVALLALVLFTVVNLCFSYKSYDSRLNENERNASNHHKKILKGTESDTSCSKRCANSLISQPMIYLPEYQLVTPISTNCHFHTYPPNDAMDCLHGSWLIFFGGSYSHVIAHRIASFYETKGVDTRMKSPKEFWYDFDFIWSADGHLFKVSVSLKTSRTNSFTTHF
jgi:hypothetical protein